MKSVRLTLVISLSIILVSGCSIATDSRIDELQTSVEAKENYISQLENELLTLEDKMVALENEYKGEAESYKKQAEHRIWELEQRNQQLELESEWINVYDEKLFLMKDILDPEVLTIEKVKGVLGDPVNIDESVSPHSGLPVISLNYSKASFTFELSEDADMIKRLTLQAPLLATSRGITVGSSKESVIEEYGSNYEELERDRWISYGEKTGISFKLEGERVKEIQIWYMYE